MMRSPAFFGFALAALLFAASAACLTSMGSSREVNSPKSAARRSSVLVGPATVDAKNVYLPAVLVLTPMFDSSGSVNTMKCSGALVHSSVLLTAGHCVCPFRNPTPSDNLPAGRSPEADAGSSR